MIYFGLPGVGDDDDDGEGTLKARATMKPGVRATKMEKMNKPIFTQAYGHMDATDKVTALGNFDSHDPMSRLRAMRFAGRKLHVDTARTDLDAKLAALTAKVQALAAGVPALAP